MTRSITTRSTNPKIMDDNIKILDDAMASASTPPAEDVSYDNTDSGLTADDVQAALDEIADNVSEIILSGSNANGSWIKFADGTLICTKTITGAVTQPTDWTEWGSLYYFSTNGGSWAETFYSAPTVSASNVSDDAAFMIGSIKGVSTTGLTNVTIVRPTAPSVLSFGISVIAVGRWKA